MQEIYDINECVEASAARQRHNASDYAFYVASKCAWDCGGSMHWKLSLIVWIVLLAGCDQIPNDRGGLRRLRKRADSPSVPVKIA